jgi:23S rRNA pseudouridine2605 synthase
VNAVARVYAVTVRGDATAALEDVQRETDAAILRKASRRESHLVVTLREGKNRQVRRLFAAAGHEVTRLKRIRLGGLELGALEPGDVRELSPADMRVAFPGARVTSASRSIDPAPPTPDARRRTTRRPR